MEQQTHSAADYQPLLGLIDTQVALKVVKDTFERCLARNLSLTRVSAPLFVNADSGLNDDLSGVERPVSFDIPSCGAEFQIVHSLAKWKRQALAAYGFPVHTGLYTDMNAIRRDEAPDCLHSVYVDQWDWEKIIRPEDRTLDYLKETVTRIVHALHETQLVLRAQFPQLNVLPELSESISFVTTQELEDLYPALTPKERENCFVKEHPVTFLIGIGGKLKSGTPHDGRAPDYDDWNLNGDLLCWDSINGQALELSSMGIRVSPEVLDAQLTIAGCDDRREFPFHKMLLNGQLPQTMGGGIGQSRVSMLLLGKAHIGEVQVSLWDEETLATCDAAGIILL